MRTDELQEEEEEPFFRSYYLLSCLKISPILWIRNFYDLFTRIHHRSCPESVYISHHSLVLFLLGYVLEALLQIKAIDC
jgi:hypothetical protein